MRSWLLLLVVLLAGCATIQPPAAPRGALVETHHGVEVADPYRWMEAMDSADTRAWVLAEDELARAYLKKLPGRAALRQRILDLALRPDGRYLVITADHDVRVAPLHSYKFVAALRNVQVGTAPILLRVETQSGHGGGSTQAQKVDQSTDVLIFFAHHLGL